VRDGIHVSDLKGPTAKKRAFLVHCHLGCVSVNDWLQGRGIDFHGYVVVNDLYGKDETPFAIFSDQVAFHTLHSSALDPDSLANHKSEVGLRPLLADADAQEFYFMIG
jgi:hypothetical protein